MNTATPSRLNGFHATTEFTPVRLSLSGALGLFDLLQEGLQDARHLALSGHGDEAARWLHAHLLRRLAVMEPERDAPDEALALPLADELLANRVRLLGAPPVDVGEPLAQESGVDWLTQCERDSQWTAHLGYFYWAHPLPVAYARTDDEAYAERWLAFVEDFIQNVPRGAPLVDYVPSRPMVQNWQTACDNGESTPNSPALWISLAAAWRVDAWLDGLILLANSRALTPERLFRILGSLASDHYLCLVDNPRQNTPNQFVHTSKALLRLGLTLPELQIGSSAFLLGYARLQEAVGAQMFPDGSDLEQSPNYNANMVRALEETLALLERAGAPPQRKAPFEVAARLRTHWILNACAPSGKMHDIAKAHAHDMRADLRRWSLRFAQPEVLWAATNGSEGEPPAYQSVAFLYGGYYVLRDGWTPDSTQFLFKASARGRGHAHEDALSLILHAHGQPLLIDSGHYSYTDQHEPDRGMNRYCESSWSHSTVVVDGWGQQRKWLWKKTEPDWRISHIPQQMAAAAQPLPNRTAQGKVFQFIEGEYGDGYAPGYFPADPMSELLGLVPGTRPEAESLVGHRRQIVWVKGRGFLVLDWMTPHDSAQHTYSQLWQLAPQLEALTGNNIVIARGVGDVGLELHFANSAPLDLALAYGSDEPTRGWYCPEYAQRVAKTDVQVNWSGAGPQLALTWLQPFRGEIDNRVKGISLHDVGKEHFFEIKWHNGECWNGCAGAGGEQVLLNTGNCEFNLSAQGATERDGEGVALLPSLSQPNPKSPGGETSS